MPSELLSVSHQTAVGVMSTGEFLYLEAMKYSASLACISCAMGLRREG